MQEAAVARQIAQQLFMGWEGERRRGMGCARGSRAWAAEGWCTEVWRAHQHHAPAHSMHIITAGTPPSPPPAVQSTNPTHSPATHPLNFLLPWLKQRGDGQLLGRVCSNKGRTARWHGSVASSAGTASAGGRAVCMPLQAARQQKVCT